MINVTGNSKTRDKVIRRELLIREGVKFSGTALRRSKENVNRLGFFEPNSVVFNTITPKGKDDVLDVEVNVVEVRALVAEKVIELLGVEIFMQVRY